MTTTFSSLCQKKYKEQAIWFVTAWWKDKIATDAEKIWNWVKQMQDLDEKGEKGNELTELRGFQFLERIGETMTKREFTENFKIIDKDNNGCMSLMEYLVFKYKKDVQLTVENGGLGDAAARIASAQEKMAEVAAALDDLEPKLDAAEQAWLTVKREEDILKAIENELNVALNELKKQQDEYDNKCKSLEATSKDEKLGVVERNKAAATLAQLKQEDPTPLRVAKITQEAVMRKVQKQQAQVASVVKEHEEKKNVLEQAYKALEAKMDETIKELERARKNPGSAIGAIKWMDRELFDADTSLPKAKQRFNHSKAFDWSEYPDEVPDGPAGDLSFD